jgi:hypothetical protein
MKRQSNGALAVRSGTGPKQEPGQNARNEGHPGCCVQHRAPRRHPVRAEKGNRVEEMRQRRAQRQCADQEADAKAAILLAPGRHQLHPRWVDSREREARQEPEGERRGRSGIERRNQSGENRRQHRAHREETGHGDAIGQVDHRRKQRARHEAELDAHREPGGEPRIESPLGAKLGSTADAANHGPMASVSAAARRPSWDLLVIEADSWRGGQAEESRPLASNIASPSRPSPPSPPLH